MRKERKREIKRVKREKKKKREREREEREKKTERQKNGQTETRNRRGVDVDARNFTAATVPKPGVTSSRLAFEEKREEG